jgi:hypothetical protein
LIAHSLDQPTFQPVRHILGSWHSQWKKISVFMVRQFRIYLKPQKLELGFLTMKEKKIKNKNKKEIPYQICDK